MKCLVLLAAVALVSAVPIEEKKPLKEDDKKPVDDKRGLQWPLPDPYSEGDLMLHGSISFDRVRDLHKGKLEDDVDKMILAHGRLFLRRVSKFFDDNADIKIMPILCRDSRELNGTINRWRIEIPKIPQAAPAAPENKEIGQRDEPINDIKPENETSENETTSDVSTFLPSSSTFSPSSDKPLSTTVKPTVEAVKPEDKDTYEVRRRDFYRQVGANFARLLMKEYRKEALIKEETEYLARWVADEAVHYGAVAIYCHEGENVKEIKKQLLSFLEEKP
jgi:hypothetical protein